jgi:von Willebrand factor type A domain
MQRVVSILCMALLVVSGAAIAQAPAPDFSIPAHIQKSNCSDAPRFKPTLNGKPASVRTELGPSSDQVILVVFDLTGDLSSIEDAEQAAIAEISKLPSNAWVGVLRAQDGLHVLADPTPNRQKVTDIIKSLSSSGTPGLLETVRAALSLADAMIRKSPVRVSVLYITDGSIYSYREDYTDPVINPSDTHDLSRRFRDVLINEKISKLERHISSLEAPLFVVQLHYRQNDLDQAYQNGLESLSTTTGGEAALCHSLSEIPQVVSTMFDRIKTTWRLNLAVPAKTHSHLQVGLSASCGTQDVQVAWRTHFRLKEE